MYIRYLFKDSLQALQHLLKGLVGLQVTRSTCGVLTYLQFNLGLSNILLAAAAAGNLLGLGDLRPDVL